jgi:hypothetical protein
MQWEFSILTPRRRRRKSKMQADPETLVAKELPMSSSRAGKDFLGRDVIEHFDDLNRLLGRSIRCPSVTGVECWDHYDDCERSLGTTDEYDGFYANYSAQRAALGGVSGESRTDRGLMSHWRHWLAEHRS